MMDYDRQFTAYGQIKPPRTNQQGLAPTAVKPAQLSQASIVNTDAEILGPASLNNGDSLTLQSIIANDRNPNFRLGGLPYGIAFFQTSTSISNLIGYSIVGDYTINGPMAMPVFTPYAASGSAGGSNGNNLVYLTELINNSGGTKVIYVVLNCRVYLPIGGGAG